jgi:hypothetical protein
VLVFDRIANSAGVMHLLKQSLGDALACVAHRRAPSYGSRRALHHPKRHVAR